MGQQEKRTNVFGVVMVVGLVILPIATLLYVLLRSGYWDDSIEALQGNYMILGVPYNPWREFLSFFVPTTLAAVGFTSIAFIIIKGLGPASAHRYLKLAAVVVLILLASLFFSLSMSLASLSYLWFRDGLVLTTRGNPVIFWITLATSSVILLIIHLRLIVAPDSSGT